MGNKPDHEKQPSRDPATPKQRTNEIKITSPPECKTSQETVAEALVGMPIQAALTVTTYLQAPFNECMSELMGELAKQGRVVNKGDMSNAEGLLVVQAHTLNTIFHRLAQRAHNQDHLDNFESLLKLALRAQNQCRATLETLSTIKNPPNLAFVKQANIAHNQQVNNGTQTDPSPASQPTAIDSTPQLEHTHGNYLDQGTTTAASGNDQEMETVAKIHRTKDRRRKS